MHCMRDRREAVRLLATSGGWRVALLIAAEAVTALITVFLAVATGAVVGAAATRAAVALPIAILAVLLVAQQVLGPVRAALVFAVGRLVDGRVRSRVMLAASRPIGIAHLEDQTFHDRLARATDDANPFVPTTPGTGATALVVVAGRYVQAIGAAAVVARYSVLAGGGLLVAETAARLICARWNVDRVREFHAHQERYRRAGYTSRLATAAPAAKEIRLYGLLPWLLPRHDRQWAAVTRSMSLRRRLYGRRTIAAQLATLPVLLGALFLLAGQAAESRLAVGGLTAALWASLTLAAFGVPGQEDHDAAFGLEGLTALRDVEQQTQVAAERSQQHGGGAAPSTQTMPPRSVRFEDVAFAYPGGHEVLSHLDLDVPAGSSLAIVGANGAGKTTLIKLLARLYEPDRGRITVDSCELTEVDVATWRAQLAVIFQDFTRYDMSAADNVGFGARQPRGDRGALSRAADRAGVRATIERLPHGWDTVLSRQYTRGTELSGGEWQRIALARAMFAVESGATLLALDEPTANLDVRAEQELFERFLELTSGLTTILISHRFSTVRLADRICVLHEGRIAESGTHDELVDLGRLYATMFQLQAARFGV